MNLLELRHKSPVTPSKKPPVLFLHGAYAGAWCWDAFLQFAADAGFDAYALSFRGHGQSAGQDALDLLGIDDYVQDLERTIESLALPPVLIAHSMGGFVAQRYLSRGGKAAGLALLASVPPYGLSGSAMYMSFFYPRLLMQLNSFELGSIPAMNFDLVRELLFSREISDQDLQIFIQQAQRESVRALTEMLMVEPWRLWSIPQLPALVLGAGDDHIIPQTDVYACASALGVTAQIIPEVGHAMMLDRSRDQVWSAIAGWLKQIA